MSDIQTENTVKLTLELVSAYIQVKPPEVNQISQLINDVHNSIIGLTQPKPDPIVEEIRQEPAVAIKKSVHPDFIICLEDGRRLKMLKRHLKTSFNLTPETYRAKWGLSADYPMVAPNYATKRSHLAKNYGLGRKRASTETEQEAETPNASDAPATGTRKKHAPQAATA